MKKDNKQAYEEYLKKERARHKLANRRASKKKDAQNREILKQKGIPMEIIESVRGKLDEEHYLRYCKKNQHIAICKKPKTTSRKADHTNSNFRAALDRTIEEYHSPERREYWEKEREKEATEEQKSTLYNYIMYRIMAEVRGRD